MMVGENPGQNTPASTAQTMVEMGQKIYSAIFKRIWRSTKEEFEKLYLLNGKYMLLEQEYVGGATRDDYQGKADEVFPVADPTITSEAQQMQLATAIKAAAATSPGYDHDAVERRWLKAMKVDAPDQIFKGTAGTPPPKDPKLVIAETKEQGAMARQQADLQARQQEFILSLMEERRMNNAKILELSARAENEAASAQTEQAYAQVAMLNAQVSAMKNENESINAQIDHLLRAAEIRSRHHIAMAKPTKVAA